jgi:hypothetical protein
LENSQILWGIYASYKETGREIENFVTRIIKLRKKGKKEEEKNPGIFVNRNI